MVTQAWTPMPGLTYQCNHINSGADHEQCSVGGWGVTVQARVGVERKLGLGWSRRLGERPHVDGR